MKMQIMPHVTTSYAHINVKEDTVNYHKGHAMNKQSCHWDPAYFQEPSIVFRYDSSIAICFYVQNATATTMLAHVFTQQLDMLGHSFA